MPPAPLLLDDVALALFEHSDEGVLVVTPDGEVLRVNGAACRILDRSADEIVRLGRETVVVPDEAAARFLAVRARTGIARGELTFRRADGASIPVECTSVRVGSRGEGGLFVTVFRDVSVLRAAEQAQARLAAIVEGSDDAIVSKDLEGTVTSWNGGAERMFGWRAAEIVGRPIRLIVPPELEGEEARILAALRRGERVPPYETVRLHRDGRRVDVALTVSPLRDRDGRVVGASKIARDVTARKQAERELREAREREETLAGLIPICMDCKQVRNDRGFWDQIELYLSTHSRAQFSHALCPACLARRYPPGAEGGSDP